MPQLTTKHLVFGLITVVLLLIVYYFMRGESFEPDYALDTRSGLYQPDLNDERPYMLYDPANDVNLLEQQPWSESVTTLGVDRSVIDSHSAWVKDANRGTSRPASNMPVSELYDGPVPFVGIFGSRPHDVNVSSFASQVPSEYQNQVFQRRRVRW